MKIIDIKTDAKKIALKTPFITALRRVENVEFVRVEICCDNGVVGVGEAPATVAITGEGIYEILNSMYVVSEQLDEQLIEDALEIIHASFIGSSAKAALDMAIVSLLAQQKDVPMYEYFGATDIGSLKTDITISYNDVAMMLSDAKKAYENGMEILKVKVGSDILHAIEVVKTLAVQIPHAKLLVDANQAWSEEQTLKFIESCKDITIELIEQPVKAHNLASLKYITQSSHIPILADESAFSLEDAKFIIQNKCADMINIKLMKCGGVSKAIEILEYARANDVKCMLGSMLEGPNSINYALHLALAYRDVIAYIDLDSPLLYKEPSSELDFEFHGCVIDLKTI